jgi:Cu2+-containing amine oxidase
LVEGEKRPYGTVIAPSLYAPNHQHFFNMRLDVDVAGTHNSVYQVDMKGAPAGPDNPFHNAFFAHKTLLETEKGARAKLNGDTWRTWKIENPSVLKCASPVSSSDGSHLVPHFAGVRNKPLRQELCRTLAAAWATRWATSFSQERTVCPSCPRR